MVPIALRLLEPSIPGTVETILDAPYKTQAYCYRLVFLSSFFLQTTDSSYLEKALKGFRLKKLYKLLRTAHNSMD